MSRRFAFVVAAAAAAVGALGVHPAWGGGLYLPSRGVRAFGRGGAFVAGADDLGALWYNPAGLAGLAGGKPSAALIDTALVDHSVTYTRIDSGGVAQTPVEATTQTLPIPTVAAGFDLSKRATVAFGLLVPYAALDEYPEDGAQRYSLVTLHDTMIAIAELALGVRVNDSLTVGAGVQNMFLTFHSRVVFSGCPGETLCAPEDPDWDSLGEVHQEDFFNPSGVVGLQLKASKKVTVGAAFQLPFWISSQGTVRVRLPASGFFDGSHVEGDRAGMKMTFPAMLRAGVEVRPARDLRIELGFDWEMWSQHEEILLEPKDMRIEDAAGVGVYDIGPLRIPRGLEDTFALRLGVEGAPSRKLPLTLRAGWTFETGSAPDEYLTVMTVDGNKHVLSLGVGWRAGAVRIDATFGQVLVADREVARGTSCAPILNPIRSGQEPAPPAAGETCVHDDDPDHVYVGDGTYRSSWTVLGIGLGVDF